MVTGGKYIDGSCTSDRVNISLVIPNKKGENMTSTINTQPTPTLLTKIVLLEIFLIVGYFNRIMSIYLLGNHN